MKQPIQPDKYDNLEELIAWLKKDLEYQKYIIIAKGTKREDIKDEDLTLNIGFNKYDIIEDSKKVSIGFYFDFNNILQNIEYYNEDDEGKTICPYKINFDHLIFKEVAEFDNIAFNCEISFVYSRFKQRTSIDFSTFKSTINFFGSVFEAITSFKKSVFYSNVRFTNTTFKNKVYFLETKFKRIFLFNNIAFDGEKSYIYFKRITMMQNDFFKKDYRENKIKIINTVIDGRIDFNDVYVNKIDFKGNPENSDTARFLKHEELTRSNTIKALEYKAIEKKLYEDELKLRIEKLKNKNKKNEDTNNQKVENIKTDKNKKENKNIVELYAELFSLWLSKLSNNHGQDWMKAVGFIFITGFVSLSLAYSSLISFLVFFTLFMSYLFVPLFFLIDYNKSIKKSVPPVLITALMLFLMYMYCDFNLSISNMLITYFSYLTPTNLDLMKVVAGTSSNCNLNANCFNPFQLISFYFFYILGKIAIGYGIFQTIQAFRKFNIK